MRVVDGFQALSIKQQLAMLVSVLVLGQIVLGSVLFLQLMQVSAESKQENHLKELLGCSQRLRFVMHDFEKAIGNYCNYMTPESEREVQNYLDEMDRIDAYVQANTKDYPALYHKVDLLGKVNKRLARLTDRVKIEGRKIPDRTNRIFFFSAMGLQLRHYAYLWEDLSTDVLSQEVSFLQRMPIRQQSTRADLRVTLFGGLAAAAVFVLVLMLVFVRRVCQRLSVLVENTRLMAQYLPPNLPLPGGDEIARLDRSMQDMSEAIVFANRERQAMMATVSHELRTPLTSIVGALELLMDEVEWDGGVPPASMQQAERETTRLVNLITDLLDLEKLEAHQFGLERELAYLEDIVYGAISTMKSAAAERSICFNFAGAEDAQVYADTARLQQAMTILLSNAVKASSDNSNIDVSIDDSGDMILVEVADHGCGVAESLRPILFDRFRQCGQDPESGVLRGMGLPICRNIVELHGGKISYRPADGGGAVFVIELPHGKVPDEKD